MKTLLVIMAITYTSWTDCDWNGGYTLDWSNADALRGKMILPYWEALRQAINERCAAVSYGVGILTEPLDDPLYQFLEGRPGSTDGFVYKFADIMQVLIGRYLTHTKANPDGTYNGLNTGVVTEWNPNPLYVGPDRIWQYTAEGQPVGNQGEGVLNLTRLPLAAWAHQQYELLNLLRWSGGGVGQHFVPNGGADLRLATGATYAAAVSAWLAAGWSPSVVHTEPGHYVYRYAGSNAAIYRYRTNWSLTLTRTLAFEFDIYQTFTYGGNPYVNNDYPLAANSGEVARAYTFPPAITHNVNVTFGDFGTVTIPDWIPVLPPEAHGWDATNPFFVLKFDTGGFKFIA